MGKQVMKVELLDGSIHEIKASRKTRGEVILGEVVKHLGIFESDYFGVSFKRPDGSLCWIDPAKTLKAQKIRLDNRTSFKFAVKFYPSDPCQQLHDEFTRHLFCLSVKREIRQANLTCAESMMAQIASCLVQTEFGDFDADECNDTKYISELNLLPIPSADLLNQIRILHRQRVGQKPLEADMIMLEKVRQLESWGQKPVNCHDGSNAFIKISCCESGISVFQDTLLHTWRWSSIRKLSFKQKQFILKLRHEDGTPSDVKTFTFSSRDAAKNFWKCTIETHTFFNLRVGPPRKPKNILFSRGSSFRYSGRTLEELRTANKNAPARNIPFTRKSSQRARKTPSIKPDYKVDISEIHAPHPTPSPRLQAKATVAESTKSDFSEITELAEMNNLKSDANSIPRTDIELKPDKSVAEEEIYDEPRKLRCDVNYSVCREILNTERTHLKDLQVVVLHFRNAIRDEAGIPEQIMSLLYSSLDPIFEFHKNFVADLEQRAAEWENSISGQQTISEFFKVKMREFASHSGKLERIESVLHEVESSLQNYPRFLQVWRAFEGRKLCYLPISMFLLKPICRLFQYFNVISRMEKHEGMAAQKELQPAVNRLKPVLNRCLQFQITSQLQRELVGADSLLKPGREFVREGYLRKWAGPKGGFNARMFFLFNDCVLWTTSKIDPPSIGMTSSKPWKLSVELPLNNISIELSDMDRSAPNSFAINLPDVNSDRQNLNSGKVTSMILSASDGSQREKWIRDIELYSNKMKHSTDLFSSVANGETTSNFHVHNIGNIDERLIDDNKMKQSTTTQVCWFRYCTLGFNDHLTMSQNVMAGYLMRKFKNKPAGPGQDPSTQRSWQKLWVVLNTFSIHFYKRHQESAPLANLPLLEYKVHPVDPSTIPNCKHQYIFMIKLKKHEYHFAAETEYSYLRWMETLRIATLSD